MKFRNDPPTRHKGREKHQKRSRTFVVPSGHRGEDPEDDQEGYRDDRQGDRSQDRPHDPEDHPDLRHRLFRCRDLSFADLLEVADPHDPRGDTGEWAQHDQAEQPEHEDQGSVAGFLCSCRE